MGQLLEYEKQLKSTQSQPVVTSSGNTSTIFSIATPVIKSINSTCQTLYTITKTVSSSDDVIQQETDFNKAKLNLASHFQAKLKKPFIFKANQSQNDQDFKIFVNPVYSRATQQQTLLSPCQALEKFNFNSPKVEKSVIELFEQTATSSNHETDNRTSPTNFTIHHTNKVSSNEQDNLSKYVPKSFTIDSINEAETSTNASKLLFLSRKVTNYKRSATEKLNIFDIEQENYSIEESKSNDNLIINEQSQSVLNYNESKKVQTLTRPSSIFLNRNKKNFQNSKK